jgi:hypothetical protein
MANWFDPLREDLQKRIKDFEELRDTEREKRLIEELAPITDFLNQNQLDAARLTLDKVKRILPTKLSQNLKDLYVEYTFLISVAEIEAKFLVYSGNGSKLETIRIQLMDLENKSRKYTLPGVTSKIIALRRRVDETNVGLTTVNSASYFSVLNITTFGLLLLFSILTAIPFLTSYLDNSNTDDIKTQYISDWWYSLHPEMLGALITFVLLNIIFDGGKRNQERKERQYAFYQQLLYAETVEQKQEVINEMRRERLLTGADLRGIDWEGVNLCNTNLRYAKLKNGQNIDKASFDKLTVLPDGQRFNPSDPIIENMKNFV